MEVGGSGSGEGIEAGDSRGTRGGGEAAGWLRGVPPGEFKNPRPGALKSEIAPERRKNAK